MNKTNKTNKPAKTPAPAEQPANAPATEPSVTISKAMANALRKIVDTTAELMRASSVEVAVIGGDFNKGLECFTASMKLDSLRVALEARIAAAK